MSFPQLLTNNLNRPVVVRSSDSGSLLSSCAFLSVGCFFAPISEVVSALKENSYLCAGRVYKINAVNHGKTSYKCARDKKTPDGLVRVNKTLLSQILLKTSLSKMHHAAVATEGNSHRSASRSIYRSPVAVGVDQHNYDKVIHDKAVRGNVNESLRDLATHWLTRYVGKIATGCTTSDASPTHYSHRSISNNPDGDITIIMRHVGTDFANRVVSRVKSRCHRVGSILSQLIECSRRHGYV